LRGGSSRIAIIGGGISGLGAAWYLAPSHDVHVFERAGRLGGHTHTHPVRDGERELAVDSGFIVYNETTYPLLTALFDELGVETQTTNMSFSMHCERCDLRYSGLGATGMFVQKRNLANPAFHRLLAAMQRFHTRGRTADVSNGAIVGRTLEEFVRDVSRDGLGDHYVYPLASALWSTGIPGVRGFPAETFVSFFRSHRLFQIRDRLQWRSVVGGSHTYVDAMRHRLEGRTHAGMSVEAVERQSGFIRVRFAGGSSQEFDRVIFAVPADEALRLLKTPSDRERELLGAWQYAESDTWVHSDASFLGREKASQASWNYHLADCRAPQAEPTMTYNLNRLQRLGTDTPFLVTLNPGREPERVTSRMTYRHPVFTTESVATQEALRQLGGENSTFFAGAHLGYGFHEDGLRSAADVATRMGVLVT